MASRSLVAVFAIVVGIGQADAQLVALRSGSDPALPWQPTIDSSQPAQPQALYVLLAGDTSDEKIGVGVREDLTRMTAILQRSAPDGVRINFTVIHGGMATRENILNTIAAFRAGPADAVVFYWSGHGAYNDAGHFLILPGGDALYRTDVINAIQQMRSRLAVVITDSCNDWSNATLSLPHVARYQPTDAGALSGSSPLFSELLLKSRGLVDINGASPGEGAVIGNYGSLFTFTLCFNLEYHAAERLSTRRNIMVKSGSFRLGRRAKRCW